MRKMSTKCETKAAPPRTPMHFQERSQTTHITEIAGIQPKSVKQTKTQTTATNDKPDVEIM